MPKQAIGGCDFEMAVADVFEFTDGRTVFVGEISQGPNFVRACDCELLVAGVPVAKFRIEGEMIPMHKEQTNLRSISTVEKVDLDLDRCSKEQCKLRSTGRELSSILRTRLGYKHDDHES
jgi:hypothetical protein